LLTHGSGLLLIDFKPYTILIVYICNFNKMLMLSSVLLFLNIGSGEMVLILFAALMLFGGNKLPELARGLGKGIRDFKDASEDVKREINNQINNYDDKKAEKVAEIETTLEPEHTPYEPVAGTIPAFQGHAMATDIVEDPIAEHSLETVQNHDLVISHEAPVNYVAASTEAIAEDATYEHQPTELKHPVTGSANTVAEPVNLEQPVKEINLSKN
jgi:sec-independent protein translocase protein TatA